MKEVAINLTEHGWEILVDGWPSMRFERGLYAGGSDDGKRDMGNGCQQYQTVHRWDDSRGSFRKSDDATCDAVLKYFYSVIEKPCKARK
jgi:hypothetical protein